MAAHCDELLVGWTEISAYLGVTVSTLKVWRDRLDMPVLIVPGPGTRKTYCATKQALTDWLKVAFDPSADYRRHSEQVL